MELVTVNQWGTGDGEHMVLEEKFWDAFSMNETQSHSPCSLTHVSWDCVPNKTPSLVFHLGSFWGNHIKISGLIST